MTLRLAHLFDEVVGLDPDRDMLAEAAGLAARAGVTNARWECMRAEELPGTLGRFRVVAFAASFHWMDRPTVARIVRAMLDVTASQFRSTRRPTAATRWPRRQPLGCLTRFHPTTPSSSSGAATSVAILGQGRHPQFVADGEDAVFVDAGFEPAREVIVPDGRVLERTIDDLVATRFSSSPSAPHLFGERIAEFESDLRNILADASTSGCLLVRLPDNIIRIRTTRPRG